MVAGIEDYSASIVIPGMVKVREIAGGHPVLKNGRPVKYSGGFCVVFPYEARGRKYAIRCWHTPVDSSLEYFQTISAKIQRFNLPYFVDYKYCSDGILTTRGLQPIILMDWIDAVPLKKYLAENLGNTSALDSLASSFLTMTEALHEQGISHGDMQHGNIMVKHDGSIVLVDYDSLYVIGMDGVPDDIKGLPGFQHPARMRQRYRSTYSDFFSELVIYTSIKALALHPGLWNKLRMGESDTLLLSSADIQSGGTSDIFRMLEGDRDLRLLGRGIKDALRQQSLDRIVPLQDLVAGQAATMVENISSQWQSKTFRPNPIQSNIDLFNQLADIASRW